MTQEEQNKKTTIKVTKGVVEKLKMLNSFMGNGDSLGSLIGRLTDAEIARRTTNG